MDDGWMDGWMDDVLDGVLVGAGSLWLIWRDAEFYLVSWFGPTFWGIVTIWTLVGLGKWIGLCGG
jgi:hypothetical protein